MTAAVDAPAITHTLDKAKSSREYLVTGAPDTKGPGQGSVTIRPEKLVLTFYDGKLRWVSVKGPTVRRDGQVTTWRDVGFSGFPFTQRAKGYPYDVLPDWVAAILAAEGIEWPGGREPNDTLQKLWRLLPGPCPLPDVFNGYDLCGHGVSWSDCIVTTAAFLVAGVDPDEERRRILAKARTQYIPDENEFRDGD